MLVSSSRAKRASVWRNRTEYQRRNPIEETGSFHGHISCVTKAKLDTTFRHVQYIRSFLTILVGSTCEVIQHGK
jgi:hypothetical protein